MPASAPLVAVASPRTASAAPTRCVPWQFTTDELREHQMAAHAFRHPGELHLPAPTGALVPYFGALARARHCALVRQALADGMAVPDRVRAEHALDHRGVYVGPDPAKRAAYRTPLPPSTADRA